MRLVYTDENPRLRSLAILINSPEFRRYVNRNIAEMKAYSSGVWSMDSSRARMVINRYFKEHKLYISPENRHLHGIGNNNAFYVQDTGNKEYIGFIHLNRDPFGYLFCSASDIDNNKVSNIYQISVSGMKLMKEIDVDWDQYAFGKRTNWVGVYKDVLGFSDPYDNWAEICVPSDWLLKQLQSQGIANPSSWLHEHTADDTLQLGARALAEDVILDCSDKRIDIHPTRKAKAALTSQIQSAAARSGLRSAVEDRPRETEHGF